MIVSLSGGRASLASVEPGVGQGQVWKKGRKKWRKGLISEIYLFCRDSPKRASQWSRRFPPYLSEIHTSWSFISRTIQASRLLWHRSLWQNAYGDSADSPEFKNDFYYNEELSDIVTLLGGPNTVTISGKHCSDNRIASLIAELLISDSNVLCYMCLISLVRLSIDLCHCFAKIPWWSHYNWKLLFPPDCTFFWCPGNPLRENEKASTWGSGHN